MQNSKRSRTGRRKVHLSMTFRCACGATTHVTGTMDGCKTAERYFARDHKKPGCYPVTKSEQRRLKAQRVRQQELAERAVNEDDVTGGIQQATLGI